MSRIAAVTSFSLIDKMPASEQNSRHAGFCKHCIKVAKHLTLLHDRNKFCSSVIADLLTRTAKHAA